MQNNFIYCNNICYSVGYRGKVAKKNLRHISNGIEGSLGFLMRLRKDFHKSKRVLWDFISFSMADMTERTDKYRY